MKTLLIVDPQNDFITGTLAVPGAKEKMVKLAEYIKESKYNEIWVTMDSHPEGHCSFKENGGPWPPHCIKYTNGWDIPEYLDDVLGGAIFYWKGTEESKEEYSIFDNEDDGEVLKDTIGLYIDAGKLEVDICGIAGDFCVLETLKGLLQQLSPRYVKVLTQYTASIDGGEKLMNYIKENNLNYE